MESFQSFENWQLLAGVKERRSALYSIGIDLCVVYVCPLEEALEQGGWLERVRTS